MKSIGIILIFPVLILFFNPAFTFNQEPDDINKFITDAITNGNASGLSKYLNTMVDLTVLGTEDTYSKTQATRILQDFFVKYPIKSYKLTKEGFSNDGSRFAIGELVSGNKVFRVFYLLKKNNGSYLIHQFQVQE